MQVYQYQGTQRLYGSAPVQNVGQGRVRSKKQKDTRTARGGIWVRARTEDD